MTETGNLFSYSLSTRAIRCPFTDLTLNDDRRAGKADVVYSPGLPEAPGQECIIEPEREGSSEPRCIYEGASTKPSTAVGQDAPAPDSLFFSSSGDYCIHHDMMAGIVYQKELV